MLRSGVDAQIPELYAGKRSAWQHALDCLLDHALRKLAFEDRFRSTFLDSANVAGVITINLLVPLLAGQHRLGRVDDDDLVSVIDMRRIAWLVLAAQPHRHDRREPAHDKAIGVDHHPLSFSLWNGLRRERAHGRLP